MALNNGNSSSTTGIVLKLVAEQGPTEVAPKFVQKVKGEDGKWGLSNTSFTEVSGKVVSMKTTNNGKTGIKEVRGFAATLVDGDETYYIDSTMSNASKDLANHLLGSIGQSVVVKLYINKAGYPTASVKLTNGDFAPTKFDFKGLDRMALYDAIRDQEEVKEEVSVEDLPF